MKIKILGGGLSGLSAGINLAKAGYSVEIFEKNSDCGERFHGDIQGLENWTEDENVLDSLAKMRIETNFDCSPFRTAVFTNCEVTEEFSFDRPLFYLVKRGDMDGSIDQGLKKQALEAGVTINFNKVIDPAEADIVATGPRFKHISVADKGIVFKTDFPNIAVGIVNDRAAYKGYSYLLVVDGYGCLCTCVFDKIERITEGFEFSKKYIIEKYKLKIENPKPVGGVGYFSLRNIYKEGKSLFVGEAAGIQDFLFGFGMRTAIISGYLAAISIIEKKDYTKLADEKFKKHLEAGIVNRYAWEHININNYRYIMEKISKLNHSTDTLRSVYNFNFIERLEYPIALQYIKKQYPQIFV